MHTACLRQVTIEASDDFLVLATDGVWGEAALVVGGGGRRLPRLKCIRASARHPLDHSLTRQHPSGTGVLSNEEVAAKVADTVFHIDYGPKRWATLRWTIG
jgi:hypothetical protein